MRLSDDAKRAMRAWAEWELGSSLHAAAFVALAESDDPIEDFRHWVADDNPAATADEVLAWVEGES